MFKIKFIGVGSAFTLPPSGDLNECDFQSNALITFESGEILALDCESDFRFALAKAGLSITDISAYYVSHIHADYVGGLESVAFTTYFASDIAKPLLVCPIRLIDDLWNNSLRGGLDCISDRSVSLCDYFYCFAVPENSFHEHQGVIFEPIKTRHVMSDGKVKHSYGLMIGESEESQVFFTGDTQFTICRLISSYNKADLILHDCETSSFKTGVHAHFTELCELPEDIKQKIWLYHYQPGADDAEARANGFGGFIQRGEEFCIDGDQIITPKR